MSSKPRVLFNASVILAGLASPSGGSGKLLHWVRKGSIQGVTSEIILDEVMHHRAKLGIAASSVHALTKICLVVSAPKAGIVRRFESVVIDVGDAHVLASAKEHHVDFLVTLGKKHLLVLQKKIHTFAIVSPKEFIDRITKNS